MVYNRKRSEMRIEKGKLADIIIINGSPLSNISEIRKIETVIKDGQILDLDELTKKINAV